MKKQFLFLKKMLVFLSITLIAVFSISVLNSCDNEDDEPCDPTDIIALMQVGSGEFTSTNSVSVQPGDVVVISPGPEEGGTWAWTGTNGFASTDREITISDIQANAEYVVTYTNDCGATSSATFTIGLCTPAELRASFMVDDNSWISHTDITVQEGSQINFGPGPVEGTWSWTGPKGFTESNRDIVVADFTSDMAGDYTAIMTNESGCQSYITFHVTVTADCVAPYGDVNWTPDGWGTVYQNLTAVVPEGITTLEFGPGPGSDNYTWDWTGPTGNDLGTIRDFVVPTDEVMAGVYTGVFTNLCGASSTDKFHVYVNASTCSTTPPADLQGYYDLGDGSWPEGTNVSLKIGDELTMGPGPNRGTWEWIGPDGEIAGNSRELKLAAFTDDMAGAYTAVFTEEDGCSYALTYNVAVTYTLGNE